MPRKLFASGTAWEPKYGYSRAVRVGAIIHIAGTTATDAGGNLVAVGDMHGQTVQTLANIGRALERAGASFADVVRTRIYVTDISRADEVGRAHGEVFRDIRPVSTMVEVARLIDPDMLVEIEAEAVIDV